jgi:ABC-2 type transport system permease protein
MLHEPRTIFLMLFAPIFAMFVFGLAFSGDVKHVKVAVYNADSGVTLPVIGTISVLRRF